MPKKFAVASEIVTCDTMLGCTRHSGSSVGRAVSTTLPLI